MNKKKKIIFWLTITTFIILVTTLLFLIVKSDSEMDTIKQQKNSQVLMKDKEEFQSTDQGETTLSRKESVEMQEQSLPESRERMQEKETAETKSVLEKPLSQELKKPEAEETTTSENQQTMEVRALEKENSFLVVIDPGHQAHANLDQEPIGPGATETKYKVTGGTTGVQTKVPEYELNLKAAFLLKRALEDRGMQVVLTREKNEVDLSNSQRATIANEHNANLFVRLHADGSENPNTSGFSILVPSKDNPYTKNIFLESEKAANTILSLAKQELKIHEQGIFYRSDMAGFNWSKVPVILPEIGFMTNPEEDMKLSDNGYLEKVMNVIAEGIAQYR